MEPAEPADRRRRGLNSQRKPLGSVGLGVEGSQLTRGRVFIVSAKNKIDFPPVKHVTSFFDVEIVFVAKFESKFVLISNCCSSKCPALV